MKIWYEELFSNYANQYDKEFFTQGTEGEVNFIEKELNFNKNIKILDVGCGTGRHAIELSKRGYNVTGIDLSENQLEKAREKAKNLHLKINFLHLDARNLTFSREFDAAIMICEGGFSLMETDEMNFDILKNIEKALKNNGKLIFTTLNALFPLFHSVKDFLNQHIREGDSIKNSFDLMTFRAISVYEVTDDSGEKKSLLCNERYYTPCEISWLLKSLNFRNVEIFGAELGKFDRKPLSTDDYEMLVVASK